MNEERRPEWLEHRLAALPAESEPGHDLWPGIEARIRADARARVPRSLRNFGIAASVAAGLFAALFAWQLREQSAQPDAQLAALPPAGQLNVAWQPVRDRFAREWPEVRAQLDPGIAAVIDRNLAVIRAANDELQLALEQEPDNPALRRLLQQTLTSELDVYRHAWDISRQVAGAGNGPGASNPRGTML